MVHKAMCEINLKCGNWLQCNDCSCSFPLHLYANPKLHGCLCSFDKHKRMLCDRYVLCHVVYAVIVRKRVMMGVLRCTEFLSTYSVLVYFVYIGFFLTKLSLSWSSFHRNCIFVLYLKPLTLTNWKICNICHTKDMQ